MKGKGKAKGKAKVHEETNAPKSGERLANFFSYSTVKRTEGKGFQLWSLSAYKLSQFSQIISYATQFVMGQRGKRECDPEVYTHS